MTRAALALVAAVALGACVEPEDGATPDAAGDAPEATRDAAVDARPACWPEPSASEDTIAGCRQACASGDQLCPAAEGGGDVERCASECARGRRQSSWCPAGPAGR